MRFGTLIILIIVLLVALYIFKRDLLMQFVDNLFNLVSNTNLKVSKEIC